MSDNKPCACTEIPYYAAYRCSKCNAVNVFAGKVGVSEEYFYKDEKETARIKANEKAEKKLEEITLLENVRKPWVLNNNTCKKCKHREPWSRPIGWGCCFVTFLPILLQLALIPIFIIETHLPNLLIFTVLILAASFGILISMYFGSTELDNQRVQKLDDINLPHVATDKEGLLKCLHTVDPQNEYGNLDDFEKTLYAERREYYENEQNARPRKRFLL